MTGTAPSAARTWATPRPIPLAPPVTTTILLRNPRSMNGFRIKYREAQRSMRDSAAFSLHFSNEGDYNLSRSSASICQITSICQIRPCKMVACQVISRVRVLLQLAEYRAAPLSGGSGRGGGMSCGKSRNGSSLVRRLRHQWGSRAGRPLGIIADGQRSLGIESWYSHLSWSRLSATTGSAAICPAARDSR